MSETAPYWPPKPVFYSALTGFVLMWAIAGAGIGLAEDEAYYWTWSKSLQWGYFDHAPMVAWWVRAGTILFGDTAFGVRFLALLGGLIAAFALWRTIALLADKRKASICMLVYCGLPMVSGNAVLITPDAPAMFFWALSIWAVAERLASGNRNWWLIVGAFVGFGLLSKYSVLFLGVGLSLCILTSKELRRDLFCWQLWVGGAISVLLFVPVIWWNATHEWVSFLKQMGRVGQSYGYDPRFMPELLGAIFVLFHPAAIVLGSLGIAGIIKARQFVLSRSMHLAVSTSLPFVIYLLWHAQFARVEGNWPAPLCFAFVLMLAPVLMTSGRERLSKSLAPTGALLAFIIFSYAMLPLGIATGETDKTNQLRGWEVFGAEVQLLAGRENLSWIATSSYGTTALLRWASRNNPDALPIIQLNERMRYTFETEVDTALVKMPALYIERSRFDTAFLTERFGQQAALGTLTRGIGGRAGEYSAIRLSEPKVMPLSP